MKIKKTYIVWGTQPNAIPAIPDVLHITSNKEEANKVACEAKLLGYTNVSVFSGKKKELALA